MKNLHRSLTINERYRIIEQELNQIQNMDTEAFNIWRGTMTITSITQFENMLKHNNYKLSIFRHAVDYEPEKLLKEHFYNYAKNSDWYKTFLTILKTDKSNLQFDKNRLPYILRHFIFYAELKIVQGLDDKIKSFIKEEAVKELLQDFLTKITSMALKCIVLELNLERERGNLVGTDEKERYIDFIRQFDSEERIIDFFDKYIVLARLLTENTERFINNVLELFNYLKADKDDIISKFNMTSDDYQIVSCAFGLGDGHNGNKTVVTIEFINGHKLVYKPKNLDVNISFKKLCDYLNKSERFLELKATKTLSYKDHGYEEFIEHFKCKTHEELENFYIRFGYILCLIYLLNGTDMHMENLIAHGEYPVIVDLETLLQQPHLYILDQDKKMRDVFDEIFNSVERTALLTVALDVDGNSKKVEIGALKGSETEIPDVLNIVAEETDRMRFEKSSVIMPGSKNIPYENEKEDFFKNFKDIIIKGFEEMYNYFLEQKEGSRFCEVIEGFKYNKMRCILKDTNKYDILLNNSYHPDMLTDMLDREKLVENLWATSINNPNIINSEVKSMMIDDIPYFSFYANENNLYGGNESLGKYSEISGYDYLVRTLSNKSIDDMRKQVSLINLGFKHFYTPDSIEEYNQKIIQMYTLCKEEAAGDEQVVRLVDDMLDEALEIDEGNMLIWLKVLENDEDYNYTFLGSDFYDGMSGIALLLYYYSKFTGCELYRNKYLTLLNQIKEVVSEIDHISDGNVGFTSIFSLLHMMSFLSEEELKSDYYRDIIDNYVLKLDKIKRKQLRSDYLNGVPSLVSSLLRIFDKTKDTKILDKVILFAERLYEMFMEDKGLKGINEIGFAHGYESIALMFYNVYKVIRTKKYLEIANSINRKSIELIRERLESNCKWCNGITGSAIAQISIWNVLNKMKIDTIEVEEILDELHTQIVNSYLMKEDCLCHGNAGIAEYFLIRFKAFNLKEDYVAAKNIIDILLKQYHKKGYFHLRQLEYISNIGLFTGISGVLYEFLRLKDPDMVPSILS